MKVIQLIIVVFLIVLSSLNAFGQSQKLSLSDALGLALKNNYGIRISELEIQSAEIGNNRGVAGGLPSIGFDASSYNSLRFSEGNSTDYNSITTDLGVDWIIFDGFKVKITMDKLQLLEDLSKGQSVVVIENTIQDVISNYYYILLLQENLKVLDELMRLSKDRYDYEQSKFDLGATVSVNVLQAKNIWLNDKADFLKQEIELNDAYRSLNYLIVANDNPEWDLSEDFKYEKKDIIQDSLLNKLFSSNQLLKNQYLNQSLKEKERKIKESDFFPELSVSAGLMNSHIVNPASAANNTFYPYGNLSLSYNIFNGGVRSTAVKLAQITEEITQIQTEEMKHSLTNLLLGVYENYLLKNDLLTIAEESLDIAKRNLQIAGEKYKMGSISSFDYRDIQLIYLNAAQRKLSAIYDLIETDTELIRLTGGFINPD